MAIGLSACHFHVREIEENPGSRYEMIMTLFKNRILLGRAHEGIATITAVRSPG